MPRAATDTRRSSRYSQDELELMRSLDELKDTIVEYKFAIAGLHRYGHRVREDETARCSRVIDSIIFMLKSEIPARPCK